VAKHREGCRGAMTVQWVARRLADGEKTGWVIGRMKERGDGS